MIKGNVLNSDASLNNFIKIGALEFLAGDELVLVIQLENDQLGLRYIPVSTNITTATFNNSDGTTFDVVGVPLADDRSIITFTLTEVQTATLLGGNVKLSLDLLGDGTSIKIGMISSALSRIIIDDNC